MNGTRTQSSQSRTRRNKIFGFISAAMVACVLFFSTGLPVFASSLPDPNLAPVTMTAGIETFSGHLTPYQIVDNYGLTYDLTNTNNIYDLEILPNSGYLTVIFKGLVSVNNSWTGLSNAQLQSTIFGVADIRTKFQVSNLSITSTVERVSVEELSVEGNYNYISSARIYNATSNSFEVVDNGHFYSEYVSGSPRIAYNLTVFASYRVPCTDTNLQSVLANLATQTVAVTGSSTRWDLSMFYGENNTLEMLDYINTRLYDIYRYDQSIYGAVVQCVDKLLDIDGNLSSVINYLYSINNNLTNLKNNVNSIYSLLQEQLNNRNSPTISSNYESEAASMQAAQSEADVAIESAVPEYSSEFLYIENQDPATDISQTHTTAINFWTTIGEYILSVNQIGAAATGLILVSLIAFIVFLLRL